MKKKRVRLSAKLKDVNLVRRFKGRLAVEGLTYRSWLAVAIKNYLAAKRSAKPKATQRKAVTK
jgi:hypothetical protein